MNGQLCNNRNDLVASSITLKRKNWKKAICNCIGFLITWIGIIIISILALPLGILALIIIAIWTLTDTIASWFNRKGKN